MLVSSVDVIIGQTPVYDSLFVSCSRHVAILHYTKNDYNKVVYFLKIYYRTLLYDSIVSGASVDPTSQVRSFAMLVLQIAGN
jgi:hypothetical protein